MSDILRLTTTDKARGQLGASEVELTEDQIINLDLEDELKVDLYQWFPNYQALLDDTSGEDIVDVQLSALKSYARYFCAYKLVTLAPMQFLQKKADGDNQGVRYNHKDTIENLKNTLYDQAMEKRNIVLSLETSFTPQEAEATVAPIISIGTPATDYITGS